MYAERIVMTSLTRISDLAGRPFRLERLPRDRWHTGDYVAGRVTGLPNDLYRFELTSGRMMEALPSSLAIGALGDRHATLEGNGSWRAVPDNGAMHALTSAGLFGRATSQSALLPPMMTLAYEGHVVRDTRPVRMADFVRAAPATALEAPVILLIGTSMSAGKTTSGRLVVRLLKTLGLRVTAAKVTGAGRYRDILSFADAGADRVIDFVDAGLPSTIVDEPTFRRAMAVMLGMIQASRPDVVVIEAGASPLEPYNVGAAVETVRDNVAVTILCASDPYAVLGVLAAFPIEADLVAGPAAATGAAVELVRKLCNLDAANVLDADGSARVERLLRSKFTGLGRRATR